MSGILYIVSTPIGNLEDMTYRAVEVLNSVDWVIAEDTRTTRKLLFRYKIETKMDHYHDHSDDAKRQKLIRFLKEGQNLALVSDAGTPLISDPGYRLVKEAVAEKIAVVPIPGASAVVAALSVSGLPTDSFTFIGFLSNKSTQRQKRFTQLQDRPETLIFYESCHRVVKCLEDMQVVFGDRQVSVSRELTKKFEETFRGSISEAIAYFSQKTVKGEIVICLAGK